MMNTALCTQKHLMDMALSANLRMERTSQHPALANQHRQTIVRCQHLHVFTYPANFRRSNECHCQLVRNAKYLDWRLEAVQLLAVGIALNIDVDEVQRSWRVLPDCTTGKQDGAGTGAIDGQRMLFAFLQNALANFRIQAGLLQQLCNHRALAAGDDKTADAAQILHITHLHAGNAHIRKHLKVFREISL